MIKDFEQTIAEQLKNHNMVRSGENVIVGVSGGRDSVCLLHVLHKLESRLGFKVFAVHVNHMLRGSESERDKEFVRSLCEELNVPCMAVNTNVNELAAATRLSVEEAGRLARKRAFEAAARRFAGGEAFAEAKIVLAHHMDDNVETVLLNMIRGTGISGLKGMLPVSKIDKLTFIRPLLKVERREIERYIKKEGLRFVEDSTNSRDEYTRNKIRLNVIPEMQRANSRATEHIADTAGEIALIHNYLERQIEAAMIQVADSREDREVINVRFLSDYDIVLRTGVIHRCISKVAGTSKDITRTHVMDVLSLAEKQTGRRIELPYGLVARRSYENIVIRIEAPQSEPENASAIRMGSHINISLTELENGDKSLIMADGSRMTFRVMDIAVCDREALTKNILHTKWFDYDTIKGSLILGRPQADDEITFAGGTKTLRKFFVDEKIPFEVRDRLLILRDINSTLWVVGYRIGEQYKITDRTDRVLEVSITGGNNG
ncbi:MAG: tRNA lysidine(34) synthetase TilS [Lachnospiraceae bacterium]